MRENKFRGKRLDNGEWAYGDYFRKQITDKRGEGIRHYIGWQITDDEGVIWNEYEEVDPATVGQYWRTIKDKHLFDGDIFRFKVGDEYIVRLVRYSEEQAAFCIIGPSQLKHERWMEIEQIPDASWWKEFVKDIEIIGNIHDNPELLTNV